MSKEIIINADKNQTRIALIENGELIELYIENAENERTLGDIYLGRIRRTMPSIQAAFVDIGQKQDAFLHYSDLADNLPQWLELLQQNPPRVESLAASIQENPQPTRPKGPSSTRRPKRLSRSEKKSPTKDVAKPSKDTPPKNGGPLNGHSGESSESAEVEPSENGAHTPDSPQQSRPPGKVRRRPTKRRNNKKQIDADATT